MLVLGNTDLGECGFSRGVVGVTLLRRYSVMTTACPLLCMNVARRADHRVLWGIFGHEREQVAAGWRGVHSK
jgi:hypothetical protein